MWTTPPLVCLACATVGSTRHLARDVSPPRRELARIPSRRCTGTPCRRRPEKQTPIAGLAEIHEPTLALAARRKVWRTRLCARGKRAGRQRDNAKSADA